MEPADYNPYPPEVHEYVDGRMTSDDERDFERRMSEKPELKRQVLSLQKAIDLLHAMPVKQPPEGFDEKVLGRIRQEELADRARKQIALAPTPWWKHAVQVGVGAAAASIVFALAGGFGLFGGSPEGGVEDGSPEMMTVSAQPTEQDLLPALADHKARFDSLKRSIAFTRLDDPRAQRRVIAMELEHSELQRRNRWLAEQIAALPASDRVKYNGFVESLDDALRVVDEELAHSRTDNTPVNLGKVVAALDEVDMPVGTIDRFTVTGSAHDLFREDGTPVGGPDDLDEITAYTLVRQADYRHDDDAMIAVADGVYLRLFGRGRFVDQVNAMVIGAMLRKGESRKAVLRFQQAFGEYDEDLTPQQHEVVKGLLTADEYQKLSVARDMLRD